MQLSNLNAVEIILGHKQERSFVCISCYHNNANGKSVEGVKISVMVFNATFNNILVISWRTVLLVEETGVPEENYRPAAYLTHKCYHIILYRVHRTCAGFELTKLVVIGTDCTGTCKSN